MVHHCSSVSFACVVPMAQTTSLLRFTTTPTRPHVVASSDGSSGYSIAASDGIVRCVIPNGTVIPARGHFLCANIGRVIHLPLIRPATEPPLHLTRLSQHNINDNAGIALFSTSNPANFNLGTRFDAVGSTSEANALYKEGAGYPALIPFSIDYSFYRSYCPVSVAGADPVCTPGDSGIPQDTNDNALDFVFVDYEWHVRRRGPTSWGSRTGESLESGG